jgi:hypothetical protein
MLLTRETPETICAWMLGANPSLEHQAAIELLHYDDLNNVKTASTAASIGPAVLGGSGYTAVACVAEEFIQGA